MWVFRRPIPQWRSELVVTARLSYTGRVVVTGAVELSTVVDVVVDGGRVGTIAFSVGTVEDTGDSVVVVAARRVVAAPAGPAGPVLGVPGATLGGTVITTTMDTGGELTLGAASPGC